MAWKKYGRHANSSLRHRSGLPDHRNSGTGSRRRRSARSTLWVPRLGMIRRHNAALLASLTLVAAVAPAFAAQCPVTSDQLKVALQQSVKPTGGPSNGGLDNNEWAAAVDTNGTV